MSAQPETDLLPPINMQKDTNLEFLVSLNEGEGGFNQQPKKKKSKKKKKKNLQQPQNEMVLD